MLGGIALLILLVIAWRWLVHKPADAAQRKEPPAIAVDTATAKHADVPIYMQGLGTVQAFYTVTVTARVDGQIEKVDFTEGQTVRKGDLLAQIDPRPNQAAYEQAVAAKEKDAAMLENAKRDLERYVLLQPQDLASKQTVDTQRALVDQLAAQLKVDQAVIDNARTQLEYTRITSPITGRTGIRLVDPGNIVHGANSTGIVVVTQLQPMSVLFTIPEDNIAKVMARMGTGATLPAEAWDRSQTTKITDGTLASVDSVVDPTTGSVTLRAVFSNPQKTLLPGMYVRETVTQATADYIRIATQRLC